MLRHRLTLARSLPCFGVLSRGVTDFKGEIRYNYYRLVDQKYNKAENEYNERHELGTQALSKKKRNVNAWFNMTKHLATMDWMRSRQAPLSTKLCYAQIWWRFDNTLKNMYGHHIIKKHLKFVDPFKKKDFAEKYFERSLEEVKRAIAKAMLESGYRGPSSFKVKVERGDVQHTRVFLYKHEKDIRAQVVLRYDVKVVEGEHEGDVETVYITLQRFLQSAETDGWIIHEVLHTNNFNDATWESIYKKWEEVKQKNYFVADLSIADS